MHFLNEKLAFKLGYFISQFSPAALSQLLLKYAPSLAKPVITDDSADSQFAQDTRLQSVLKSSAHVTDPFTLNACPNTLAPNHLTLTTKSPNNSPLHLLPASPDASPQLTPPQAAKYAVELSGVSKRYPHHNTSNTQASSENPLILNDVYLNIIPGETVVLLGPSGCGKSTLLRLLNGLEKPTSGVVSVNNTCFNNLPRGFRWDEFRADVGMVFQQYNLFPHMTVLKNIMLGATAVRKIPKKQAEALAMDLLESVGLADKAKCYPYQLSGGQKQRIAIARALALSPKILLLDEPTSALDPVMTNEVLELIGKLSHHGVTLLIVTHEVQFALNVADRVLFMHEGDIIFDDAPQALITMPDKPEIINNYLSNTNFSMQYAH